MVTRTGPIAAFSVTNRGSGYNNGTFVNVPLAGGNGSGASATLTIIGGSITLASIYFPTPAAQIDRTGKNFQLNDVLYPANLPFEGGSLVSITVSGLAQGCENCIWGKIVPPDGPTELRGLRYCADNSYANANPVANAFVTPINPYAANITPDNYFCADGADVITKASFSAGITQLPSTAYPGATGSVTPDNGVSSFTFNLPGSFNRFFISPANDAAAVFTQAHGAYITPVDPGVSVEIVSGDGSNFNGSQTWYYEALP